MKWEMLKQLLETEQKLIKAMSSVSGMVEIVDVLNRKDEEFITVTLELINHVCDDTSEFLKRLKIDKTK